jgi:16S rRNA (uracil1498-N3)-methyltransferase
MRRFFLAEIPNTNTFFLPEEESKHILRVLRLEIGEHILLLDGKGKKLELEIVDTNPKKCAVSLIQVHAVQPQTHPIHLAIAPTKNTDRMEWMVEKIVEIGATELTFLTCDNSERVNLKLERLERVAISAMKQAKHDLLIKINGLMSFNSFVSKHTSGCIAHCYDTEKRALFEIANSQLILIGPEGDFSEREVSMAVGQGFQEIHLGDSRLRTETAGMVSVTLAKAKQHSFN